MGEETLFPEEVHQIPKEAFAELNQSVANEFMEFILALALGQFERPGFRCPPSDEIRRFQALPDTRWRLRGWGDRQHNHARPLEEVYSGEEIGAGQQRGQARPARILWGAGDAACEQGCVHHDFGVLTTRP